MARVDPLGEPGGGELALDLGALQVDPGQRFAGQAPTGLGIGGGKDAAGEGRVGEGGGILGERGTGGGSRRGPRGATTPSA